MILSAENPPSAGPETHADLEHATEPTADSHPRLHEANQAAAANDAEAKKAVFDRISQFAFAIATVPERPEWVLARIGADSGDEFIFGQPGPLFGEVLMIMGARRIRRHYNDGDTLGVKISAPLERVTLSSVIELIDVSAADAALFDAGAAPDEERLFAYGIS